jgi:uncharacterized protein YecE (DUF72 family)
VGVVLRRRNAPAGGRRLRGVTTQIRVGTCSWVDKGLIEAWYPPHVRDAKARLAYYAERFDVVEVDSSYYAIPDPETVRRWASRTPAGFVFTVKAFGVMTGHRVRPEQLPPDLRPLVAGLTKRGHAEVSDELEAAVFERFAEAVAPLRAASKLGGVLLQFPPSLAPSEEARQRIEAAAARVGREAALVEFRHRDWLSEEQRDQTLDWLADRGLSYVIVDAPAVSGPHVAPTVIATTTATAYVRFHGRNRSTWGRSGRGAWERFDYFYEPTELAAWVEPLRALAASAKQVYAMFNTNNADQGPVNAELLRRLLDQSGVPVTAARGHVQGTMF